MALIALRRRTEEGSIYFVCDHGGIYFPSSRAQSIVARAKDVPWLHVPWHNISDIRIQLLLDETATTKGVVLSLVATESEAREFLARHTMLKNPRAQKSSPVESFRLGFSNFFHRHDEVMSILGRFHGTHPANDVAPIGNDMQKHLTSRGRSAGLT